MFADIMLERGFTFVGRFYVPPVVKRVERLMSHFLEEGQRTNSLLVVAVAEHNHTFDVLGHLNDDLKSEKLIM